MSALATLLKSSNSKFATVLTETKVDPMRLISASHKIEALRPEDRAIRLAKKSAVGKEDEAAKAARLKKPRSGRIVTSRLITSALKGQVIPGPSKTRLLRAVNALRAAKKLPAVDLKALF
jgi:hypothetical protein